MVTRELLMLEKLRRRHNWTAVGQEEADIAAKAEEKMDAEISPGEPECPERDNKAK